MILFRIIIAGGRDFTDFELLKRSCDEILLNRLQQILRKAGAAYPEIKMEFISGHQIGADQLGEQYARDRNHEPTLFEVTQEEWDQLGRKAGPMRNDKMAKYAAEADEFLLIAFWDYLSKGTRNMIATANKHDIDFEVIRYKLTI